MVGRASWGQRRVTVCVAWGGTWCWRKMYSMDTWMVYIRCVSGCVLVAIHSDWTSESSSGTQKASLRCACVCVSVSPCYRQWYNHNMDTGVVCVLLACVPQASHRQSQAPLPVGDALLKYLHNIFKEIGKDLWILNTFKETNMSVHPAPLLKNFLSLLWLSVHYCITECSAWRSTHFIPRYKPSKMSSIHKQYLHYWVTYPAIYVDV